MKAWWILSAIVVSSAIAGPASAQIFIVHMAECSNSQMVPPIAEASTANVGIWFESEEWSWGNSGPCDLSGVARVGIWSVEFREPAQVVSVRLYRGEAGSNGELLVEIPYLQKWHNEDTFGAAPYPLGVDCTEFYDGHLHAVVVTTTHPDGLARGQIDCCRPMPTEDTSWGEIKATYR